MLLGARQFFERRGAPSIPTALDYVQTGLVAMWDGIENAEWGTHDASATTWKNLISGTGSAIGNRTWGDDCLNTTGSLITDLIDNESYSRTMEAVFRTESTDVQAVIMSMSTRRVIGITGTSIGIGPYSAIPITSTTRFTWSVSSVYPDGSNTPDAGYINGVADANRTTGNFTNPVASSIIIGGYYSKPFVGNVYCIRLYSRQLSASEIAANYAIDKARFNLP